MPPIRRKKLGRPHNGMPGPSSAPPEAPYTDNTSWNFSPNQCGTEQFNSLPGEPLGALHNGMLGPPSVTSQTLFTQWPSEDLQLGIYDAEQAGHSQMTETSSFLGPSQPEEHPPSHSIGSSQHTLLPEQMQDLDYSSIPLDNPQLSQFPETLPDFEAQTDLTQGPQLPQNAQSSDHSKALNLNKLGIPSVPHFNIPLLNCANDLTLLLNFMIGHEYRHACSHEDIARAQESVQNIMEYLASLHSNDPTLTPPESRHSDQQRYRCEMDHRRVSMSSLGALKRHFSTQHKISRILFFCLFPGCPKGPFRRRDKLITHWNTSHRHLDPGLWGPCERTVDPPPNCPVCSNAIGTWEQFDEHIKHHCLVGPGLVSTTTGDDHSRQGGDGGGNNGGDGSGGSYNYPPFAGTGNGNGNTGFYPSSQQWAPQGSHHFGTQGGPMNSHKADVGPNISGRSVSDNQLDSRGRHSLNGAVMDGPRRTSFDSSLDPNIDVTGGIDQRFLQPTQAPWDPQDDQPVPKATKPSKANGPARQKAPTKQAIEQHPQSARICMTCKHDCGKCHQCQDLEEPIRFCHRCVDPQLTGIASQTIRPPGLIAQRHQSAMPTVATLDSQNLGYNHPADYVWFPQDPSDRSIHTTQPTGSENQRHPFRTARTRYTGEGFQDDSFAFVAMVAEDHTALQSVDMKPLQSPKLATDLGLLGNAETGLVTHFKSFQDQFKQLITTVPVDLSTEPYAGPPSRDFRLTTLEALSFKPQCQCPCASLSGRKAAPERLEVTFKMSPASRRSSNPLQARLQVVVRLFTLRTSVSKSSAKHRQKKQPIKSGVSPEDDGGCDDNSEHALSLGSSSSSELAPSASEAEEVQEWSFDFDLRWAILRFIQWTSGTTADTYQKHFQPFPGRMLDIFKMYILHQYTISWSLAGNDRISFAFEVPHDLMSLLHLLPLATGLLAYRTS